MTSFTDHYRAIPDVPFKIYYELMPYRVREILLVSSPYFFFIMEEDGRLTEKIIHEYRGLNLINPPRLTWVPDSREAFRALSDKKFDLVIFMPREGDMTPRQFGKQLKSKHKDLPLFLLAHATSDLLFDPKYSYTPFVDKTFIWCGNTDLMIALIKSVEDRMNVSFDTRRASVRVIIMVEDSPYYCSSVLPLLYREIVAQTQAVMEDSLNEEHRILKMQARPKILLAQSYEEALSLYKGYKQHLLCIISDIRFRKNGGIDDQAGFSLLSKIKEKSPDIPLLIFSAEEANRKKALEIPALFLNKSSPSLHMEISSFLIKHLGFGDFIFRLPNGNVITTAANLREMEKVLPSIPLDSIHHHASRHHFSTWFMARSEIQLASELRHVNVNDFADSQTIKEHLITCLRHRRKNLQAGVITDFSFLTFDTDTDFIKVGKGSLGGKARGLAFMLSLLKQNPDLKRKFQDVTINVPRSLVISTEGFDSFITENNLKSLCTSSHSDAQIKMFFLNAELPQWLCNQLELFLKSTCYPLAIRSSSLLEDDQFHPSAGIYSTYMIPNNHENLQVRMKQLTNAIKLVYASTYLNIPRLLSQSTVHRTEDEKMAVIVQQLVGKPFGDCFYPAISGVARSYNFYPISHMKPEDGIAQIALGLGTIVVENAFGLRFCPAYPLVLPQFSLVNDILDNSQRFFYALDLRPSASSFKSPADFTLKKIDTHDASDHDAVKFASSTYFPEDRRIRDSFISKGHHIITFANILKYNVLPLPEILSEILKIGQEGMGSAIEIEFAVNIAFPTDQKPEFSLLQIRPMTSGKTNTRVSIKDEDISQALCFSTHSLGNGIQTVSAIVFVKPDKFDTARTIDMAAEISKINHTFQMKKQKYLLIGPGRWGSADPHLGIPVKWNDISAVAAIVETKTGSLRAEPSQGSHFFHNITSHGISYISISDSENDFIDWDWLLSLPFKRESQFLRIAEFTPPVTIKSDGKKSQACVSGPRKKPAGP